MELDAGFGAITTPSQSSDETVYYSRWQKSFTITPKKTVTGKKKIGRIFVRSVSGEWTDFACPGPELYKEYAASPQEIFVWTLKNGK